MGQDEVQVWLATEPPAQTPLARLIELLSPRERRHAAGYREPASQRNYVFRHALLRQLLAAALNVEPRDLVFGRASHGKPFLAPALPGADLRFNLSHSGAVVAIAFILAAVFIPVAFLGGISGLIYRQFALTIAASMPASMHSCKNIEFNTCRAAGFRPKEILESPNKT